MSGVSPDGAARRRSQSALIGASRLPVKPMMTSLSSRAALSAASTFRERPDERVARPAKPAHLRRRRSWMTRKPGARRNCAGSGEDPDPGTSAAPYRLYNIGNHSRIQLMDYIACIERAVARRRPRISCQCSRATCRRRLPSATSTPNIGFTPKTPIEDGVKRFVAWYREYYRK